MFFYTEHKGMTSATITVTFVEVRPLVEAAEQMNAECLAGKINKLERSTSLDDPETTVKNPMQNLAFTSACIATEWTTTYRRTLNSDDTEFELPMWVAHILLQIACLDFKPEYRKIIKKILDCSKGASRHWHV